MDNFVIKDAPVSPEDLKKLKKLPNVIISEESSNGCIGVELSVGWMKVPPSETPVEVDLYRFGCTRGGDFLYELKTKDNAWTGVGYYYITVNKGVDDM